MNIRLEQPKDYCEVENLTREAFWNVYRPGCTEHYVLNQYRNDPDFIPELDFVMEDGDKIIGHVMFSKAEIMLDDGTPYPSWTFGPISIHPDYKRKGYGLKLLKYALEKAKEMGIGLLQMEGNIEFYKQAGFDLASKMKIHYHAEPRESEVPYFLAQELIPGYWDNREGTYCPPKGYFVADENPEAFEAYEATFPQKEKSFREGQLPQFCQSCGMPLTHNEDCGTNADGSINFDYCQYCYKDGQFLKTMEKFNIQSLPEIIVASHREVIPNYEALGPLCYEKIGPEMQRLGCKCPPPGYCFTIEHNKEYTPTNIDIEYCEQVEEMGTDSAIIQFKRLPAVPKALCMKHVGPYERFYDSFIEAFRYMEEQGYKIAGQPRTSYIDGAWNQDDPEKWLSVIQIPIE